MNADSNLPEPANVACTSQAFGLIQRVRLFISRQAVQMNVLCSKFAHVLHGRAQHLAAVAVPLVRGCHGN